MMPPASRRQALLAGLAAAAMLGCPAAPPPSARASASHGLDVITLGPLKAEEKGGQLVVLLHGWGAQGDDLVSLGRALARPGTRFLVPAAPLQRPGGGRAWWQLAGSNRPPHVTTDALPAGQRPEPEVARAREAVLALLRDARQRHAPDSITVVGFSQGAMLALDVALAAAPPIDRVAVLSGLMLEHSLPALHAAEGPRPRVLVAHGMSDAMVPFKAGKSIKSILEPHGYAVTWVPFEGGHEIPASVVAELRRFLS